MAHALLKRMAFVLSLCAASAGAAEASAVCERLTARLAGLSQTVVSTTGSREHAGAISRQNLELRRARNERRRMGCSGGSIIVIGGSNEAACESMAREIAGMEMNLEQLKARRRGALEGNAGDDSRRRLLASLAVNNCGDADVTPLQVAVPEAETHRNILKDLPPIGSTLEAGAGMTTFMLPGALPAGGLRTLCVRTCDGAFFPISSNARPADFQRDAESCSARCPGTETELYYHSLATQEAGEMVSALTGEPYISLPTAFAYRTRDLDAPGGQCGCMPARADKEAEAPAASILGEAGLKGTQDLGAAGIKPVEERPYEPNNSKIRVVGPTFLPNEESAIDLRNPAGPGYQPAQN